MPEEIKIVVKQESQGTALKDAQRDAERLNSTQTSGRRPEPGQAAREDKLRNEFNAPDAPAAPAGSDSGTAKKEAALSKEIALSTELEAAEARRAGDTAGAEKLEREADILRRSAAIQATLGNSTAEATQMATASVEAEEQLLAAKAASVAEEKGKKQASAATKKELTDQLADEKAITREKAKQVAETKMEARASGESKLHKSSNRAGANKALSAFGQNAGGGMGMLGGMAGLSPAMLAVTAVGAVVGELVGEHLEKERAKAADQQQRNQDANRLKTIDSHSGGEGESEAAQERLSVKRELEEAQGKKGTFADQGFYDKIKNDVWNKPLAWLQDKGVGKGIGKWETSGGQQERENDLEIKRLEKLRGESEALAHKKFDEGPGKMELDMNKKLADGDRKGAQALKYKVEAQQEYERLIHAGATPEQAAEGAESKLRQEDNQWRQNVGKVINARSGAGDIAQAAGIASNGRDGGKMTADAIAALHRSVDYNHREAVSARPVKQF